MADDVEMEGARCPARSGGQTWLVGSQPRSTRPPACRVCHEYFLEGETRLCPRTEKGHGRFVHVECLPGGLATIPDVAAFSAEDDATFRVMSDGVSEAIRAANQPEMEQRASTDDALPMPDAATGLPSSVFSPDLPLIA